MIMKTFLEHALASALTLYMVLLLLRWVGPWIELDFQRPWIRFIAKATDPLINFLRRRLPPLGPADWSPLIAVMSVWLVRALLLRY